MSCVFVYHGIDAIALVISRGIVFGDFGASHVFKELSFLIVYSISATSSFYFFAWRSISLSLNEHLLHSVGHNVVEGARFPMRPCLRLSIILSASLNYELVWYQNHVFTLRFQSFYDYFVLHH